jgi:hypothetical protein
MATNCWFSHAFFKGMSNATDWDKAASLKIALMQKTYTPNPDDEFFSDITAASESDVTNYVKKVLTNASFSTKAASNLCKFDSTDSFTWTALGGTVNNSLQGAIILYDRNGSATSMQLMMYLYMGSIKSTNGGDFKVSFSTNGAGTITCNLG